MIWNVPRYVLGDKLGAGGMGAVYRATDKLTGQAVALKRLNVAPRFLQFRSRQLETQVHLALALEFQTLASLRHPHIISVLDYGFERDGQPFFTMTLLENARSLREAAQSLPLEAKIDLLIQVLQALAYLHRRGILHRDLKPGNILVENGEVVRVLDFGLAVGPQQAQGFAGTLAYMAPEMLAGNIASRASDLYAVGVMAYEMILGHHPFTLDDSNRLMYEILHAEPDFSTLTASQIPGSEALTQTVVADESPTLRPTQPPTEPPPVISPPMLGMPPELATAADERLQRLGEILRRLLAKQPTERYQEADEVITALCAAIERPLPQESTAIRESFLQAATFVGREAELGRLLLALEKLMNHATTTTASDNTPGTAILIGGESGVGKSRLVEELRIQALVKGAMVVRGQAVNAGGLPYQVWREPLRRLVLGAALDDLPAGILQEIAPDIGALLGRQIAPVPALEGEANRRRLALAVVEVLRQQTSPLLIILEDLQWADSGSLAILNTVNEFVAALPVLVVATYRQDEHPDLPATLPGMEPLALTRLTEAEIARLSHAMLGEAGEQESVLDFLHTQTEGNVFFLVEVVRALAEEAGGLAQIGLATLPASLITGGVQAIIRRRLERVPAENRALLQVAAVAGRRLDWNLLQQLAPDVDLEAWFTLCANAAVLDIQDGQPRFAHDKLREVVLAELEETEKPPLHRQVALAIETAYPDDSAYAAALTDHWLKAGDVHQAAHHAIVAARHFNTVSSFREAVRTGEPVLAALDPDAPAAMALRLLVGDAYRLLSDYAAATAWYEDCLVRARATGDALAEGRALQGLGKVANSQGQFARAKDCMALSCAIAEMLGDRALLASGLHHLGAAAKALGERDEALRCFHDSLMLYRQINDRAGMAGVLYKLGYAAHEQGDYAQAEAHYAESLAISQALGDRYMAATTLTGMGDTAKFQSRYEDARRYQTEALAICRAIGDRDGIAKSLNGLGVIADDLGQYQEAKRYFAESLVVYRQIGDRIGLAVALFNTGLVIMNQGDYATARAQLEEALAIFQETGLQRGILFGTISLGEILWHLGDPRHLELLEQGLALAKELNDQHQVGMCLLLLGVFAHSRGEYDLAAANITTALAIHRDIGNQTGIATSLIHLGFAHLAQANPAAAIFCLREGLQVAQAVGLKHLMLLALVGFARLHLHYGQANQSAEIAGLVLAEGGRKYSDVWHWLAPLQADLATALAAQKLETALAYGHTLDFATVVAGFTTDVADG